MILKPSNLRKMFLYFVQGPKFYGKGGGSAPSQPTTTTQNVNSIPSYLKPYVQTMMTQASNQIYETDPNTGKVTRLKPYAPFSTNSEDYVAPFSPLQQQAQAGAAALQTPGQFEPASTMAGLAGIGQLGTAQEAQGYGAQGANLGMGSALTSANQAGMQQAQAGAYGAQGVNLGMGSALGSAQQAGMQQAQAGMYGGMGADIGMGSALSSAQQAGMQQAQAGMYGAQGAGYGAQAAGFGQEAGMGFGGMGAGYGSQAAGMAGQGYGAGAQFAQQATDPNATAAYMSPYMQNVVNQQTREANRNYDISAAKQMGAATHAGAFGGSREALMAAENERNRNIELSNIQATGSQAAFQNAQQQQQFGANLNLQGMAAGQSALGMGIQGAQAGLQGANTALQGYQQGLAGAQAGLQGVGAQTAASQMQQQGAAQALQGAQTGLQGVGAQTAASQMGQQGVAQGLQGIGYGLQGVNAQTAASQMQQAGVGQGLQGIGYGLQGLNTAQQGYTGATQAAGQLGQLGTQQLAADTSVLGTQAQFGGQQQAQQQQAIDQAVLNWQNAQQYPFMQLGTMSNLIRGIPTGNVTQTQYQAQPGIGSQIGGLAATGLGAYAAMRAEGGVIKDRGFKSGGIVGYNAGGDVEESMRSKLEDLDVPHLQTVVQNKESPKMASIAKEVLATRLAKGGIVAFANNKKAVEDRFDPASEMVTDPTQMPSVLSETEKQTQALENKIKKDESYKTLFAPNEELLPSPIAPTSGIPMSTQAPSIREEGMVSPTGIAGVPEVPGIKPVTEAPPFNVNKNMAEYQQYVKGLEDKANMSVEELAAADKESREKFLGPDTATAEYRRKVMEEKANAPDEARRQMGMRLMEFGANWASTPGAPLVAGMRALKEELPNFMEDSKANKKAMKEIDAAIYSLDHAVRLENEGYWDRASALKEKASDNLFKATPQLIEAGFKKQEVSLREKELENTKAYQQGSLANQAASLAQSAEQFKVTSAQPTAAGMKEQAIKEVMKAKGVDYGTAYGIVEGFGTATKDPTLGYRVAMAKTKLDAASDVYNSSALLGSEAKQQALDKLQAATAEFENLQRQFDPTGIYGTVPAPSVGPRAGAGQNRIPLSSFQK